MAIAGFSVCRMCLALRASGLWLCYTSLQNLIPSFPWIVPGWRAWGCNLATLVYIWPRRKQLSLSGTPCPRARRGGWSLPLHLPTRLPDFIPPQPPARRCAWPAWVIGEFGKTRSREMTIASIFVLYVDLPFPLPLAGCARELERVNLSVSARV